ncbi:MAG: hypothetical protein JW863_02400 [Chitinispirillaceae bacterium]|nr:hypothetical protein [Chitinispirillaceae bacterium]
MTRRVSGKIYLQSAVALLIVAAGCDFPYAPRLQPQPSPECETVNHGDSGRTGSGYLYHVNISQQTCNPSVSPSPVYPACMLWLGFDRLSVSVPDSLKEYDATAVRSHDRLTVVDTANFVRWYIFRTSVEAAGEFQCPEWSTHPDYLACLIGSVAQPYSGYVIRFSDKKALRICSRNLEEFSTPHVWLPDSAVHGGYIDEPEYDANGFVTRELVEGFFGTTRVKFIYTLFDKSGTLFYVDYASAGDPEPVPLRKPESLENWYCHSPLISPDGGWVAYHCYPNSAQGSYYRSFIQRLSPEAPAIAIAEEASDPHWWKDPADPEQYYIVYTRTVGAYYSEADYTDRSVVSSGAAGATLLQKLSGTWRDVPAFLGTLTPDKSTAPLILLSLPFKGGLSPDGRFLSTAYKYAYLARL